MARRNREINIFNIAFLDVITGAMGAFVLMVLLLAPYYTGAGVNTLKNQRAAQAAADRARQTLQQAQQAQQSGKADDAKKALAESQAALEDVRQQLAALKQQIDQLSSQNKRLTALDDRQQKEINDTQARIRQLERQAAQQTTEALDQAAKSIARADQAIKNGNLDDLKRLLAQARAGLDQARRQMTALQQDHARTQTAMQQEQQQNRSLAAQFQQAQRQLAAAQAKAAAQKQTLDEAGPATHQAALFELIASSECGATKFSDRYQIFYSNSYQAFDSEAEATRFELRGAPMTELIYPGSNLNPYHAYYTLPIADDARILVGFFALSQPPANCHLGIKYSQNALTKVKDRQQPMLYWAGPRQIAMTGTHPVLVMVVPTADTDKPWALSAEDIEKWKKAVADSDVAKDWVSPASSVPPPSSSVSASQAFRSLSNGPPANQSRTTNGPAPPVENKH